MKLAVLTTHPIQYYAPVFRALANSGELASKVFYEWEGATKNAFDPGFGREVKWDIPLLDGYEYEFLRNQSKTPGSSRFTGIDCPDAIGKITQWKPDAILVYGWSYKTHLKVMRHFHGRVPVLFRGDSTLLDEEPGFKTFLRRRVLRWVYRNVDKAIYVGSNNRDYYLAHGLREEQLFFAPHAIDNARFQQDVAGQLIEAQRIRSELGIGIDEQLWLFVGKLEPKKAPELLLRAFGQLNAPHVHLGFVGTGDLEPRLKEAKGHRVHFLGFKNQGEMPSVYRSANLMILPSRGPGETWGLAINEAMACGLPILTTNKTGAAKDLVTEGGNGWVVQANDPDALKVSLSQVAMLRSESLHEMGKRSTEIISEWSTARQSELLLEAILSKIRN